MSNQNLRSLHGISDNELEEPTLHQYAFCGECQEHVLEYCTIHGPRNSKEEDNFQRESSQMQFSVNVKVEHCNSDDEIQNDSVPINPTTNLSEASEKNPDKKLTNYLAISEQCTSSLNVSEDVIGDVIFLDGNSEIALNSENLAEKDPYINKIQAQLDEEIMRDVEAEVKIFEVIQVSLKKKSEENMSKVFKRTEVIAENEDVCESGLIIVDSGVEDIATIKDSVQKGTENNFHSEIVDWNKALDYIDDGEEDITQRSIDYDPDGYKINNRLVKEMLENLCKEHSKELVKAKRCTSTFTQIEKNDRVSHNNEETRGIRIKSKRKLQTTKKSITAKKATFQNNDEDAGETDLVSKTNFKKNTFVIKKQNHQGPLFKKIVDVGSKRKSKETNTYVVPKKQKIKTANKYKYTEMGNIKDARKPVMNTNFAKFKCNENGKEYSSRAVLTNHIPKCIKPKSLVNDSGLNKADTLNSLLSEMYNCDICTFKTYQKRSIETHLKMHSTTKGLSCDTCEYRCATKSKLIMHIRTHTGEKPFSCNICEYRCSQKSTLKDHIRTHTGEKPFTCNICEFRCSLKSTFKNHIRTHTGEKPFICNICEFRCSLKGALKTHIRTHTGEKPFTCNICEFRCSLKSTLKDHIRTHTGEKPFTCNICDLRCSLKSTLTNHIRTHTGEKPFTCDICEFRCSKKSTLKDHIRTHTGEKPFTCNICEYRCSKKSTLKDHIRTHTGEKPFTCNICEFRCSHRNTLKDHIRTHTGEKPFCCNICEYRCSKKSLLNKHVKTHR